MKSTVAFLVVTMFAGCSKPEAPPATPVRTSSLSPPASTSLPGVQVKKGVVSTEWSRNDPNSIRIRQLYGEAQAAFARRDYRRLFEMTPPGGRLEFLRSFLAELLLDPATDRDQLGAIFRKHGVPQEDLALPMNDRLHEECLPDWKAIRSPEIVFDEAMRQSRPEDGSDRPMLPFFDGELRVESIVRDSAQARVVPKGDHPREDLVLTFEKVNSSWWINLPAKPPQ